MKVGLLVLTGQRRRWKIQPRRGGGVVPGSLVLIGGDPGIGKSPLPTSSVDSCLKWEHFLYVSGEGVSSADQATAERLGDYRQRPHLYAETNMQSVRAEVEPQPNFLIIVDPDQYTPIQGSGISLWSP